MNFIHTKWMFYCSKCSFSVLKLHARHDWRAMAPDICISVAFTSTFLRVLYKTTPIIFQWYNTYKCTCSSSPKDSSTLQVIQRAQFHSLQLHHSRVCFCHFVHTSWNPYVPTVQCLKTPVHLPIEVVYASGHTTHSISFIPTVSQSPRHPSLMHT